MTTRTSSIWEGWRLLAILAAAVGLMCVAMLVATDFSVPGIRLVIRATARTSLPLFCAAFAASALARLWPNRGTRWLLRNRRYVGLGFAASHTYHLVAIIAFVVLARDEFFRIEPVPIILVAGTTYLLIFAMAATSFDAAQRWLGTRRWRALHLVGGYAIWLTFFGSAIKRVPAMPIYLAPIALLLAVLALRMIAMRPKAMVGPAGALT